MAKTDARYRYTEEMIRKEFMRQLKEKPVNQITVAEICRNIQINRATFYKHYLDVYDLMDHIEQDLTARLHEQFSFRKDVSMKEGVVRTLRLLKENKDSWFALFGRNGDLMFVQKLISSFLPMYAADRNAGNAEMEQTMCYAFLSAGSTGIVTCWISGNMEMEEEKVAEMMLSLCSAADRQWKKDMEQK